jgi:uncharacterized protein YhaN
MRIERLLLERYGHFTGQELDFSSPEVRLHVVLGANEAGKTTALHAVRDLLFGIDERSSFDVLHDYKVMRRDAIHRAHGRSSRRRSVATAVAGPQV